MDRATSLRCGCDRVCVRVLVGKGLGVIICGCVCVFLGVGMMVCLYVCGFFFR